MINGIKPNIHELLSLRYQAKKLGLLTRQRTTASQVGNNASNRRGRGMDFEEVRAYQPGDDIRLMHWALTARLGKPFTKIYREERERSIYLLIDQSHSMRFGTRVCFKSVLAARLAALLGWSTLLQQEQIGGVVFDDNRSGFIQPNRSRQALLDVFNLLTTEQLPNSQGGLTNTLQLMLKRIKTGSIVVLISDYTQFNDQAKTYLNLLATKANIINIHISDPIEANLPRGEYAFTADGSQRLIVNTDKNKAKLYQAQFNQQINQIETISKQANMPFIRLNTTDDLASIIKREFSKYGY